MSTAIWGEPEAQQPEEVYTLSLLKHLLLQMMVQFSASGACIALHDEDIDQMKILLHLRLRNHSRAISNSNKSDNTASASMVSSNGDVVIPLAGVRPDRASVTVPLTMDPSMSAIARPKRSTPSLSSEDVDEITPQQSELFPVGATYPVEHDLIGYVWFKNETHIMRHEDYLSFYYTGQQAPLHVDVVPTWYLAAPIQESTLVDEVYGKKKNQTPIIGVVILYQTVPGVVFQQKQRGEARDFAERISLYLQNEQLRRRQDRTSKYLKQLQEISTAFPTTVLLARLVQDVYQFTAKVVDVSSMLITFYDRDTKLMYDVFAIHNGSLVEGLTEHPRAFSQQDRPVWWWLTQEEKKTVLLEPIHEERDTYDEILNGTWGDQSKAGSFLLLPMKMFNRVIGSLCLTSMRTKAYAPEEILVLEAMVQIITVSIENAKLYENTRKALRETSQREDLLAAMNSALQMISISTALDVNAIRHKFVESAAKLVQAEISIFFQCTDDMKYLVVEDTYESANEKKDGDNLIVPKLNQEMHLELLEQIHLPFKSAILEQQASNSFFYLDRPMAEEIAKECDEGGAIFLLETHIQRMLMIPVLYQTELIGILGIHSPDQNRHFRPTEVGMLLALSAQAASAIRNAQLFEQVQEAYAEQQQLDKLKDEFLVTASHELRTPLSAISGYSTLLKRQSSRITPQQILRYAAKITGATQQLIDLVSSMTEAAKIGTIDKKMDLQMGPLPLQAAVEMAVGMFTVNIEQKILMQVPPDLWVHGDPLRVRQVISNLLDNAAKYSAADGRIEIIAGATLLSKVKLPDDQYDVEISPNLPVVVLKVYDEGEGIAPEDQQRIFEKFVRATRSLTTPVRGSGLGLYICRRYIEAMGGKLWLEHSTPGEGSTFSFYLPRTDAPPEVDKSEQDEPAK